MKLVDIAVDFDGTLCRHKWPEIGEELEGAIAWCTRFQGAGARLILYTMRSDEKLQEAIDWCKIRGLEFWAINENLLQSSWSSSRKIFAQLYIDDAALGAPLKHLLGEKPHMDWDRVGPMVMDFLAVATLQE